MGGIILIEQRLEGIIDVKILSTVGDKVGALSNFPPSLLSFILFPLLFFFFFFYFSLCLQVVFCTAKQGVKQRRSGIKLVLIGLKLHWGMDFLHGDAP